MGSGASKGAKAKAGFEAPPGAAALRRRRRLLLAPGPKDSKDSKDSRDSRDSRDFEQIPPWEQFRAPVSDPVFDRARDSQDLRRSLEDVKDEMGYLRENAMELLQLNLRLPSKISRRLYHLARVQNLGEPIRKAQLTCFEVLCLSSALRWSSESELLELLFCFFDADGDDKVGFDDLVRTIDAFLSEPLETLTSLSDAEKKDFRKLDERRRMMEVRRIAQQAIAAFALQDSEEEDEEEAPELPVDMGKEGKDGKDGKEGEGGENKAEASDKGTEKETGVERQASTSSKVAETGKLEMPQPKKAAKGGRGLCGRAPKEEQPLAFGLESEAPKEKDDEKPKATPKPKAKPKAKAAKAKSKPKSGGGLCGVAKPRTLSFRQWSSWIITTDVLPPGLLEAAKNASKRPKQMPEQVEPVAPVEGTQAVTGPPGPLGPIAKPSQGDGAVSLTVALPEPRSPARSEDTPDADDVPHKGTELSQPLLSSVS